MTDGQLYITLILLFVLAAIGYIMNIVRLCGMGEVDGKMVLRIIGIFCVPLGCFMGFIDNDV